MWILYAFGSALFAGATSILAKIGIEEVDSHLATALRTIVVLVFSWLMVFIVGSQNQLTAISIKSYVFLILSGNLLKLFTNLVIDFSLPNTLLPACKTITGFFIFSASNIFI